LYVSISFPFLQEAEKLLKMLISELRKTLKARTSSAKLGCPDNFLELIQVRENLVLTSWGGKWPFF